jgi:hypothetical protein
LPACAAATAIPFTAGEQFPAMIAAALRQNHD